ncbi:MAG: magnesium transporter CorA family protein, partial [Candidatus Woesearchaeota archaeon]
TLKKDKIEKLDFDTISKLKKHRRLFWTRVLKPSDEEFDKITDLLSFDDEDKEELRDFFAESDRPRLSKEEFVEIIYSAPYSEDNEIKTDSIAIYIKNNLLVTFERKSMPVFEKIASKAQKNKNIYLFKKRKAEFIAEIIDMINDDFLVYVNRIANRTDILSSKTMQLTEKQIEAISSANTTLAFFNQSILANIEVLNSLRKIHSRGFTADDRERFRDLYADGLQILDTEKVQREVIMNIFNMQSIISTNRINTFMKKLTSLALIVMIPTLITGIYGMNINGLPLSDASYSFYAMVGFLVLITGTIYLVFKKINWV